MAIEDDRKFAIDTILTVGRTVLEDLEAAVGEINPGAYTLRRILREPQVRAITHMGREDRGRFQRGIAYMQERAALRVLPAVGANTLPEIAQENTSNRVLPALDMHSIRSRAGSDTHNGVMDYALGASDDLLRKDGGEFYKNELRRRAGL